MTTKRDIINTPVEDLRPHPKQALVYGETVVDDAFVESIKRTGILQMPVVKVDDEDFGFVIISGHRRVEAAKQAGLTRIECEVRSYETPEDEEYDFLIANKTRDKNITQILNEIKHYKQISRHKLNSEFTKELAAADMGESVGLLAPQAEGAETGENGKNAPVLAPQAQALSDREIARISGLPKATLWAYNCVFDMLYRDSVIDSIAAYGIDREKAGKQVNELWESVGQRVRKGEVSLREAHRGLLDARREMLQRLDAADQKRKNSKGGGAMSGLKAPKVAKAPKAESRKIENTTGAASDFLNQMARNNEVPAEDSREFLVTFAWKYCDYILKSNK